MEGLSAEVLPVLKQLMPGFLAMIVFYWFAEVKKPAFFDKILQALIATTVIQIFVSGVENLCYFVGEHHSFGVWNEASSNWTALVIATVMGLALAFWCNNDTAFRLARFLHITTRASQDDTVHIYKALANCGVILHFIDERRLMGYLDAYPSNNQSGIYLVSSPIWITDEKRQDCPETQSIMIACTDVQWVEFLN